MNKIFYLTPIVDQDNSTGKIPDTNNGHYALAPGYEREHSVASIVSSQHGSFPSGFPRIPGAYKLPRPQGIEAFPRHLTRRILPLLWFAASPSLSGASAG